MYQFAACFVSFKFILNVISQGYKIPFFHLPKPFFTKLYIMPSTVNTSFLSKVDNKLLSFNLAPESYHIPDIFYPLLFIHSGEHRFTFESRHVYVHFCFLTKNLSLRTCPWPLKFFTSPVTIILKSFLISGNSLNFAFDSVIRIFRFSGFFNHACFFSGFCKRPFIVLSKFLNPEEPRYPFCPFSR